MTAPPPCPPSVVVHCDDPKQHSYLPLPHIWLHTTNLERLGTSDEGVSFLFVSTSLYPFIHYLSSAVCTPGVAPGIVDISVNKVFTKHSCGPFLVQYCPQETQATYNFKFLSGHIKKSEINFHNITDILI